MLRKAVVTIYVRHQSECPYSDKPFARGCDCPKWLRYSGDVCLCGRSHKGRQHRFAAGVRSWAQAEEKREEAQKRLDAGDQTPLPVPERAERRRKSPKWEDRAIRNLAKAGLQNGIAGSDKVTYRRIAERARLLTHVPENRWGEVVWFEEEE